MERFNYFSRRSILLGFLMIVLILGITSSRWGDGSFSKGYLGVSVSRVDHEDREKIGVSHGVIVKEVVAESPAEKAGIEEEDIILYFGGEKIRTTDDLIEVVRAAEPKSEIKITVFRNGKNIDLTVVVGLYKSPSERIYGLEESPFSITIVRKGGAYMGVELYDLDEDLADYFGTEEDGGALILSIEGDSPADKAGLKAGDVIVEIDEEVIVCPDDVRELMSDFEEGDEVKIAVLRKNRKQQFKVELGEVSGTLHLDGMKWFDRSTGSGHIDIHRHFPNRKKLFIPKEHLEHIYEWEGDIDLEGLEDLEIQIEEKLRGKLERIDEEVGEKLKRRLEHIDETMHEKMKGLDHRLEHVCEIHHI